MLKFLNTKHVLFTATMSMGVAIIASKEMLC